MNDSPNDPGMAGLRRFRKSSGTAASMDETAMIHGRMARTLAASKPGGLMLCVNRPDLSFWLFSGMDVTSKLICLASDEAALEVLTACHDDDIRITLHCQHPIAFLGDVRDHRFDLLLFSEIDTGLAELATSSLACGGLVAVFPSPGASPETHTRQEAELSRHGLLTSKTGDGAIFAARIPDEHLRKRRGARKRRRLSSV